MGNTDRIQVPISASKFTGAKRSARHVSFTIDENLDMQQQVCIQYVDDEGKRIHDIIQEDDNLTPDEKMLAKMQYPDRMVTKTTAGAWCDPKTGEVVAEGTEGVVPQLDFFQALTVKQMMALTGTTTSSSFAQVLYAVLAGEITKIDNRGGL